MNNHLHRRRCICHVLDICREESRRQAAERVLQPLSCCWAVGELVISDSLREDLMLVGVSGGMVLTHSFGVRQKLINLI